MVYYSQSVYQSTTYTQDGDVETKRKEIVQSNANVPSLLEKYGNDGIDIDTDEELNNEILILVVGMGGFDEGKAQHFYTTINQTD